jgi:hypothetical protein
LTPNLSPRKEKAKTSKKRGRKISGGERGNNNNNKTSISLSATPKFFTAANTGSPIVILSTCSPAPTILAVAVAAPTSMEENALIVWYASSALYSFKVEY